MPRTKHGFTFREVILVKSRLKQRVRHVRSRKALILHITRGLDLPRDFALIRSLSVGIADRECEVHPSRVSKGAVVDGHTWVQLDVVLIGPLAVFTQDCIVGLVVSSHRKRPLHATVNEFHFFGSLDYHSAPVVAFVERRHHWVVFISVHEALVNVAEECPKEITFVLVLIAHKVVETLFAQTLDQDFLACHGNTLGLEIVLLVECWGESTVNAV